MANGAEWRGGAVPAEVYDRFTDSDYPNPLIEVDGESLRHFGVPIGRVCEIGPDEVFDFRARTADLSGNGGRIVALAARLEEHGVPPAEAELQAREAYGDYDCDRD